MTVKMESAFAVNKTQLSYADFAGVILNDGNVLVIKNRYAEDGNIVTALEFLKMIAEVQSI